MPETAASRPVKLKALKAGSSKHKSLYQLVCGGINRIADDGEVTSTRIVNELRAIREHCDNLLNEMLLEAVTGAPSKPRRRKDRPRIMGGKHLQA